MKSSVKSKPPGTRFFPSSSALVRHSDPDGLVAVNGTLSLSTLLEAYRLGIFPWPTELQTDPKRPPDFILLWFCPPTRAILEHKNLTVNRTLAKVLRSNSVSRNFRFSLDQAFDQVIEACATIPRPQSTGTWITPQMIHAYQDLFRSGHAHSVEVWDQTGALVGGIYGVEIDGVFSAESMFHRVTNASKLALLFLMESLHQKGIDWIDIQMMTPHLQKLGARKIKREHYLRLLSQSQQKWKLKHPQTLPKTRPEP